MFDNDDRKDIWNDESDANSENTASDSAKTEDIFAEEEVHFEDSKTEPNRFSYMSEDEYRRQQSTADGQGETSTSDRGQETLESSSQYRYQYRDPDRNQNSTQYRHQSRDQKRKHKKHMSGYVKAICTAILCGVIVGGCVLGSFAIGKNVIQPSRMPVTTNEAKLSTVSATSANAEKTTTASDGSTYTVSQINQQCSSSVVAITNKGVSEVQTMFGVFQQESEGSGSGVIVAQTDDELLIATNNHVVEGSEELTVCFNDSEDAVFSAQVKGTDASNDLAVIAISLSDISDEVLNTISIATIGDSDTLEVGDQVVAIGNALGLGKSVTSGIVSAVDREVTIEGTTSTLLQTDAAINPGNSGGALFNMKGELVGINSAKFASEEVEGMGFAIPMSTAKPIIENLMTKETRTKLSNNYGVLNITGLDVSTEASQQYGIPAGIYVSSVLDGAAAANAGMQKGDVITSINGTTLTSISQLQKELQYYKAGENVEIGIQRNNGNGYEAQTLTVTLDNVADQDSKALEDNYNKQNGQNDDQSGSQNTIPDNEQDNSQSGNSFSMDPFEQFNQFFR